ncbi:hypothetical protein AB0M20_03000 [Actinoplanes sp. NPDC051633]|uniref:hypothetical protein n=1 Tax=Actinoplanes sp. NPDC051633 TaxID=3155670 RepID=UPI00343C1584
MNHKRSIARAMLVLAVIMTVGAVAQTPANASTSRCYVKWPSTSCKTATMRASSSHDIYYSMCAPRGGRTPADWQVKDAANGFIVGQGHINPGTCVDGHIPGLYGSYWGWVFNTRDTAIAYISNQQ